MLQHQLEKKMLNMVMEEVRQEENIKAIRGYEEGVNMYLTKNFTTLGEIVEKVRTAAQFDDHMKNTMAKTYFKHAKFTDKILRRM
jgi:hypothetical protein